VKCTKGSSLNRNSSGTPTEESEDVHLRYFLQSSILYGCLEECRAVAFEHDMLCTRQIVRCPDKMAESRQRCSAQLLLTEPSTPKQKLELLLL
jgi:hypothetical protein